MKKDVAQSHFNIQFLQTLSQDILAEATKLGAAQAEVGITTNKGFVVSAHNGDVETVEYNQDKDISINVYFGKRIGTASISDVRKEAIRDAVEAACHIAKFTDEDPASGLAEKEELAFHYPDMQLAFPWSISVDQAIELACLCEREAVAADKRIMSAEPATVATLEVQNLYANSNGFMGHYTYSRHELSCVLIAKAKDEMQRDYSYTVSADPTHLKSAAEVARQAVERTVHRLGARRLKTCKVPVIYAAEEARSLLSHFSSAISGGNLYRKSSFLLDQLGKQIFPSFVRLQEFPHLSHGIGSAPFDSDGVATRDNIFVSDGVVESYALGVYSARKLNMRTTGNSSGMHNLTIQPGKKSLPELLKEMHTGLLVTDIMGNGVNLLTGDYSRGVAGFWVENGEIQYPVHEITVAGTLQEMYKNIIAIGNDVDDRGNIRTGSILLAEMTVAGG